MSGGTGQSGRHGDDLSAQGGAAGDGVALAGQRSGDARVLTDTPNAHGPVTQGADAHSSIKASSVVDREWVKVESPQRSEEN